MAKTKEQELGRLRRRRAEAKATGMCRWCFTRPATHGVGCDVCHSRRRDPLPVMMALCGGEPRCQCPGCQKADPVFLTIDHIHNDAWKERATAQATRQGPRERLALVRRNPERYQVLCYNCNCAKGHSKNGRCPRAGTPH